jgi:uncharacterized protein (UPF0264 family)
MSKLLVSVRDAAEAEIALEGGADLIDVKEPSRGALGAADDATIRAVVEKVAGRAPVSAALGELVAERRLDASFAGQLRYAKFGLAGCLRRDDWTRLWRAALDALPERVVGVAVVYADWKAAGAPEPWDGISRAAALGCGAVLVDTFDKRAGPLGRHAAMAELGRWLDAARTGGLMTVVAGGLGEAQFDEITALGSDYVAVRGAACVGGRTGGVDAARVRRLATLAHRGARWRATCP